MCIGTVPRKRKGTDMAKNVHKATREFGLTVEQAEQVESLVSTVSSQWQAMLRMALVIGIGELTPGKPFQDVAHRIIDQHSNGTLS